MSEELKMCLIALLLSQELKVSAKSLPRWFNTAKYIINDANNDPSKKLVIQCLTKVVPREHNPLRPLRRAIAIATVNKV